MSDSVSRLNKALEGRYRIERQLGEGGMATVYLAKDLKHDRDVALKVLKPELAAVVGAQRFLAEIQTTAKLQHPHILPLFDSGQADSFVFYVMPYVEGESLQERLDRDRQLPVDEAVSIASDAAEALDYAHRHGVIHRDIKPANVLLQDGKPVVSDFGIALAVGAAGGGRLTETGLSLGTPSYMSPEQAMGDQNVGPATDVYALGCVLFEMLVGEPPYTGGTAQAILGKILAGEPVSASKHRASVPPHVDATIRRALEKVPADRFAGARDFARALADGSFRHGVPGPVAAKPSPAGMSRRDFAFLGIGALAGAAGTTLGFAAAGAFLTPVPDYYLVWVDRNGTEVRLPTPPARYRIHRISPDGSRIAVSVQRGVSFASFGRTADLWVYDAQSGAGLRLTSDDEFNGLPIWSPDGRLIYFNSTLEAPELWGNIYSVPADGSAAPSRVTNAEVSQALTGITPDGSLLVYAAIFAGSWDITTTRADGTGGGAPLLTGRFRRGTGDVSPDGRWLAYRSDEAGDFEIYVQPFPGPGAKVPVSIGGGNEPVWSHDGRELYYRRPDGMLMAATISDGPQVTDRTELFDSGLYRAGGSNPREYHVAPDGRFLMLKRAPPVLRGR